MKLAVLVLNNPAPIYLVMSIKYTKKDLKTDLIIGGVNGMVFASIFGFYTASLETPRIKPGFKRAWSKLFCTSVVIRS